MLAKQHMMFLYLRGKVNLVVLLTKPTVVVCRAWHKFIFSVCKRKSQRQIIFPKTNSTEAQINTL